MKVELRARPVAYFKLTRANLELLKHCAKLHYDGACQRTLDHVDRPIGNLTVKAKENGLLTMWQMDMDLCNGPDAQEAEVSCTANQADLLAKVTEIWMGDQFGDKTGDVRVLHKFFYDLVGECNRAYGTWKMEVEL